MKLNFDYYHNLEKVELYLCNPDGRELFPLFGRNRNLTLRFNDLSELTFDIDSTATLSNGRVVDLEAYDYIQTKRLIFATDIGWFQISNVDEHDNGNCKYKQVKAESHQSIFKNKGFLSEERVYCFYNPSDPYDDVYDSLQESAIPSVLGQWRKQLGVQQDLAQGLSEPLSPYEEWTVTYIDPSLIYGGEGSLCRTFKENTTFGYDWMTNDVEEAFGVVVLFDFMYKTIHVMTPGEVAQKINVIYTFDNFMKDVTIKENADDIVTVLNCNGDNCNITGVNPTGTNYICDFSYYMDEVNGQWMSKELIQKLKQWQTECDNSQGAYINRIDDLRDLLHSITQNKEILQEASLRLQDLKTAQAQREVIGRSYSSYQEPDGLVMVETVPVQDGTLSNPKKSLVTQMFIDAGAHVYAYQKQPTWDSVNKVWDFAGDPIIGTPDEIIQRNLSDGASAGEAYWYIKFPDSDLWNTVTYGVLQSDVTVKRDGNGQAQKRYFCSSVQRYIIYYYPRIEGGHATYGDWLRTWVENYESVVAMYNEFTDIAESYRAQILNQISDITSHLNLLSYFADTPDLLRELNSYWIEGDYTNENISVLEDTPPEDEIVLAKELMVAGYVELRKICQPRFTFSLESIDVLKQYEFLDQMSQLELGKVVTIEKKEDVWYYPALLEMSMNLDDSDSFSLTFANSTRLDDWGYTYADLIAKATSTSRKVNANWQDITSYAKKKDVISSLIRNPLDTTLRAALANMTNQEFSIDTNGILGRRRSGGYSAGEVFDKEQIRLINNVLLFTDDEWNTSKTALGKIYYEGSDGAMHSSYGLIAETIIGSLIMGEKLKIQNSEKSVEINESGIVIKNGEKVVFEAKSDGTLNVSNYLTKDNIGDAVKKEVNTYLSIVDGEITLGTATAMLQQHDRDISEMWEAVYSMLPGEIEARVSESGGTNERFSWKLNTQGFSLFSNSKQVMSVTKDGATFAGVLSAATGTFAGSLSAATGTFKGALKGATGDFSGKITAGEGTIGGWNIGTSAISNSNTLTVKSGSNTATWTQTAKLTATGVHVTMQYVGGNPVPVEKTITREIPWYQVAGMSV